MPCCVQIPSWLQYRGSRHSPPVLVVAEPGTVLLPGRPRHQRPSRQCSGTRQRRGQQRPGLGLAGYDPRHQHMRGVLIAKGPGGDFQQTSRDE